jgi:CBS domain-containing protein
VTTVQTCLAQKRQPGMVVSVGPDDRVVNALELMREKRVRSVLVVEAHRLLGIVTQGDCAMKVLLPGHDAAQVRARDIMTTELMTVNPADPLEACMGVMASRNLRHLPVLDGDRVVGMISIGDVVKDRIREMGQQINFLETYIKGHGV